MTTYRVTWSYNGNQDSRVYYTDYHAEGMRFALQGYVDWVKVEVERE